MLSYKIVFQDGEKMDWEMSEAAALRLSNYQCDLSNALRGNPHVLNGCVLLLIVVCNL